jgi:hypothetical protein
MLLTFQLCQWLDIRHYEQLLELLNIKERDYLIKSHLKTIGFYTCILNSQFFNCLFLYIKNNILFIFLI